MGHEHCFCYIVPVTGSQPRFVCIVCMCLCDCVSYVAADFCENVWCIVVCVVCLVCFVCVCIVSLARFVCVRLCVSFVPCEVCVCVCVCVYVIVGGCVCWKFLTLTKKNNGH